ncbi:MAG: DUF4173 domain-containing protein [Pseudorhodoplanes sp.]
MNLALADKQPLFADLTGLRKFAGLAALMILADWLFYNSYPFGLSLVVYLLALGLAALAANPLRAGRAQGLRAFGVLAVLVFPLFAETSFIGFLFAALGAAYFAVAVARPDMPWNRRLGDAVALLADGSWQAAADIVRGRTLLWKMMGMLDAAGTVAKWVVPVVLGAVFVFLFASANPLIEKLFTGIDFEALWAHVSLWRIGFWLLILSLAWPFVFMASRSRLKAKARAKTEAILNTPLDMPASEWPDRVFGKAAIQRSLILFNLLFAVQTLLDALYLWGGVRLPEGMTHADYAHRGAYPLIVTALLAGAFVIVAMRPGTEAERSRPIRRLVFLWVAQNVGLVVSSLLRLDLYVEAFSLTYWRLAAFVWMLLVAFGLILIVARIVLRRSNGWLVRMNAGALAVTLYVCALVNFPSVIAHYNVSRHLAVPAFSPDLCYLAGLGPQAIPAIDAYIRAQPSPDGQRTLSLRRASLAASHEADQRNWRAWSLRDWQLTRYLRDHPTQDPAARR